ncbi:MAG: EF-hand domain-containing protein [Planctomycetota bacterium]|nr:EF-hand domain-containing protein [Planctomycetota bacterium]
MTRPARAKAPDVWAFHADKYDADEDGRITPEEYGRGEVGFKRLDADQDGVLTKADFEGPMGMDRFISRMAVARLFQGDAEPELTLAELEARFAEIDANDDGELSRRELADAVKRQAGDDTLPVPEMPPGVDPFYAVRAMADADKNDRLSLAELSGWFTQMAPEGATSWKLRRMPNPAKLPPMMQGGVAPGSPAPDFTLMDPEGKTSVTLSSFAGVKPVALIFGSYT